MKTLNSMILALGAVALLGTTALKAQTAEANVPFEFTVQSQTLPAGHYSLAPLSLSSRVIQITNLDTGKSTAVLTMPAKQAKANEAAKIIFHSYGDRYFLAEVRAPHVRGRMTPSTAEEELRASAGQQMASVDILLASR